MNQGEPALQIEGEIDGLLYLNQLFGRQDRYESSDPSPGNSLGVIEIDRALPGHPIILAQWYFTWNVPNCGCDRCHGDLTEVLDDRTAR